MKDNRDLRKKGFAALMEEKVSYKRAREINKTASALGIMAAFVACASSGLFKNIMIGSTILCIAVAIFVALKYCKCPKCGESLPPRGEAPDNCPKCGRKLDV